MEATPSGIGLVNSRRTANPNTVKWYKDSWKFAYPTATYICITHACTLWHTHTKPLTWLHHTDRQRHTHTSSAGLVFSASTSTLGSEYNSRNFIISWSSPRPLKQAKLNMLWQKDVIVHGCNSFAYAAWVRQSMYNIHVWFLDPHFIHTITFSQWILEWFVGRNCSKHWWIGGMQDFVQCMSVVLNRINKSALDTAKGDPQMIHVIQTTLYKLT